MKRLLIGLLALGSISAFAGEVFTGSSSSWTTGSGCLANANTSASKKAFKKCELKYRNCKIVDQDEDSAPIPHIIYRGGMDVCSSAVVVYVDDKITEIDL